MKTQTSQGNNKWTAINLDSPSTTTKSSSNTKIILRENDNFKPSPIDDSSLWKVVSELARQGKSHDISRIGSNQCQNLLCTYLYIKSNHVSEQVYEQ